MRDSEPFSIFPFVVGSGRSGTTLLRSMLNAHPELAIPRESHFLIDLAANRSTYEGAEGLRLSPFISRLRNDPWLSVWDLRPEVMEGGVAAAAPRDLPSAIRALYETYARAHGKKLYGDKTPSYVMHMTTLSGLFPEARFVHLIRDGRDVALSFLEARFGPTTVEEAALHWRQRVARGRAGGRRIGPARYRELRYEDLVAEPEASLREVCRFLDLPFRGEMLQYQNRMDDFSRGAALPQHHANLSRPPTSTRSWRREMSSSQVSRFELLAGKELESAGYPLSGKRPSPADRLAAGLAWSKRQRYRVTKKLGLLQQTPRESVDRPPDRPG